MGNLGKAPIKDKISKKQLRWYSRGYYGIPTAPQRQ